MSELRKDPLVQRWVVMAPERALRPIEVTDQPALVESEFDPFAEGNEAGTTSETLAFRSAHSTPNGPGWRVRVIPNKYPAVSMDGTLDSHGNGLYDTMTGVGAHEVIIECPHTEPNMSRLSYDNIREVLLAYRQRLVDLKQDPRLLHALIFKNQGALAGASVHHSHSQLIATPFVPSSIREELAAALEFYQSRGQSIFEVMIQEERATRSRVVVDTPRFLAFCPFASRFAYETWILPRSPGSHFEHSDESALEELAFVLKTVLRKLELALDNPAYNYVLHSSPFHQPDLPHYVWHFEILPRQTRIAGFEWGSGCYINEVLPEQAAAVLRETVIV